MGLGLESVLAFGTATSGSFVALSPGTGQSLSIRNFTNGTAVLEDVWASDSAHAATISIHSPKMHDDVYGILAGFTPLDGGSNVTFNPQSLLTGSPVQTVYATDTLTVATSATSSDKVAALLNIRYTDISGINARLYDWATISPLIVNEVGVQVTPTSSGTANQWGTAAAFNSGLYRLKADTDYAVLGVTVNGTCNAVYINGIDTGNLNVGAPGYWNTKDGADFFVRKSNQYGTPHIPVINSNNAANISVNASAIATSVSVVTTWRLAQLSQKLPNPAGGF